MHQQSTLDWVKRKIRSGSFAMHMRDQGFTFCISPDKTQGRWLHPVERRILHPDWTDVTEWPSEQLVAFLMPEPEQQDLFAA